jgi:hypothetical protein
VLSDDRCRLCRRPLTDKVARMRRIGPDCWADLTPEERAEYLELAIAERRPGYIPPDRPASPDARQNTAAVRQAVAAAQNPTGHGCEHGAREGRCALCRRDQDADQAATRIIRLVRAERRAAAAPGADNRPAAKTISWAF